MTIGKRYRLSVHPAGAAAAVTALLFLPSRKVLAAFLALLLHETGHMAAMYLSGVRSWRFELTPFGGMADVKEFEDLRPLKRAACAAAGVAVSLFGAWSIALAAPRDLFCREMVAAQLSLAFVNCLPVWPLDGARALAAVASCLGWEQAVRRALAALAKILGAVMVLLGLWSVWIGQSYLSLLFAGPYLWYASREGVVSERVRMIGKKHSAAEMLPVTAYTCKEGWEEHALPKVLGRLANERYHLLISIGKDGSICRVATEEELLQQALQMESIDGRIL